MHFRHHFNSETLMSVCFRVNAYRFGQPTSTLRKDLGRGTLIPARDVLGVAFAQTSTMPERDRLKRPTEEQAVDVLRLCKEVGLHAMGNKGAEYSPQVYARLAGVLYLIVIVCGGFAEIFVRQRLVVANDAAATANNILAHEQLFRWGFAADLAAVLCVMPLIMLLYELLKVINRRVALMAVFFSLVGCAVQSAALLGHFAPVILLTRGRDLGVNPELLRAQAYMALQLQSIGYAAALAFFGGTMLSRGYLILHARFMPRIIGLFLAIEGVCYLVNSFVDFLAPGFANAVLAILMVSALAEVLLCFWLLVIGVNVAKWREVRASV